MGVTLKRPPFLNRDQLRFPRVNLPFSTSQRRDIGGGQWCCECSIPSSAKWCWSNFTGGSYQRQILVRYLSPDFSHDNGKQEFIIWRCNRTVVGAIGGAILPGFVRHILVHHLRISPRIESFSKLASLGVWCKCDAHMMWIWYEHVCKDDVKISWISCCEKNIPWYTFQLWLPPWPSGWGEIILSGNDLALNEVVSFTLKLQVEWVHLTNTYYSRIVAKPLYLFTFSFAS